MKNSKELNLDKRFWHKHELTETEAQEIFNDILFNRYISSSDFNQLLKEEFTPYLKKIGFKGSKNNFYKLTGNYCFYIGLFKDKYGGETAINVGIHLRDYPQRGFFESIDSKKITPNSSIIGCNLTLENGFNWFRYGKNIKEAKQTIRLMINSIEKYGIPFFDKFKQFPYPFSEITIKDLKNPTNKFEEYSIDEKMLSWIHFKLFVVKINIQLGLKEKAREILNLCFEEEYNSERFTTKGVSPLLTEIDKLIKMT